MIKEVIMTTVLTAVLTAGGNIAPTEAPLSVDTKVDSGLYVGAGVAYDNSLLDKEYFGTLVAGYDYNKYIGGEVRVSNNFTGDETVYSAFLKPQYPIVGDVSVYGLLGGERSYYGTVAVNDYAVGAGVEYSNLRLDTVYNEGTEDYKTLVSYVYKF